MAEEMALLRKEMRAERSAQLNMKRMAEEMALLRMEMRAMGRPESPDSDVSFKSDRSIEEPIDFIDRVSPRWVYFGSDVSAIEDFNKLSDNRMVKRMLKSSDSGVSFKSDWSKRRPIDFKDRVSVIGLDFSSSVKKHVVADDGFFESPDDLEKMNQELSSEVGWKHG